MEEPVEVLCGCYEQVLFGYRAQPAEEGEQWIATADFTHHAHTASLSVVAVNNRFVATGSKDETIQIYDLKKKVEHGSLLHHNGTITCLEFHDNTHLLSGAEDGLICVWNTKKWECQQTFKAHKGQVLSLSIHPSGKLALSVGTDKTLRTWNLIEGRSAFIKNIKQNAHVVQWSPSGEKYIVVIQNQADVYKLETAKVIGTISNPKRISSVQFITDAFLAVAGDEEYIRIYDVKSQKCLCEFKAHETRVKNLYCFEHGSPVLVSSSSDGYVKLWKIDTDKISSTPSLLCEVSTSARLTCLSVWLPGTDKKAKSDANSTVEEAECPKKKRKAPENKPENTEEKAEEQMVHKKRKLPDKQKKKRKQNQN